jgi:non-ribosomal peptide synthetase component F
MNELRVTWAILTASVIKLIHPDELPSLDTLVLGGEPIPQFVIDLWAPQKNLYNAYGPTECCLCAAVVLKPGACSGLLGTPRGAVCWIVDALDHNKLAPIGAIGELLVEGPLVARGYLYDQVRTDASFVDAPAWLPNAVERPPSFKFYKTGDLVQYMPDGMLKLIGRLDAQVKVRGQRVELGEIEYRIRRRLPHLRGLAVEIIQPEKGAGNPLLAAFVCVDAQLHHTVFPRPLRQV